MPSIPYLAIAATLSTFLTLSGCDQHKMEQLHEGLSTETDVRTQLGEPEMLWQEADGSRTLEYPRQPLGHKNYMVTIGTDGKLQSLRQVLTPRVFDRIQPGMTQDAIRRLLGKPARRITYPLKQETSWEWNWIDPPSREMELIVTFGPDGLVQHHSTQEPMREGRR